MRRDAWAEDHRVVFVPARLSLAARPPLSVIVAPETWLWTPAHFACLSRFETDGVADMLVRYTVWTPSADDLTADDWGLS